MAACSMITIRKLSTHGTVYDKTLMMRPMNMEEVCFISEYIYSIFFQAHVHIIFMKNAIATAKQSPKKIMLLLLEKGRHKYWLTTSFDL